MGAELVHRGPDGVGLFVDGEFAMVNTRLSVIDVAGGDQPIASEDGRYWVMQNGEIYNHPELRQELTSLGHHFTTTCDTEVIVHAYQQWGPACLDRFNGPFALAVWDRRRRELFLARDRFGVRPLFLADFGGELSFASEAKALLRHPRARRELDHRAVVETFTLWTTLPDRSAFQGIRELAPGSWLCANADGQRERRWWHPPFGAPTTTRYGTTAELATELRDLLHDAAALRLRADVPVAAYLSGGLDSSAIVGLARRASRDRLACFGVTFTEERFDESSFQRQVADHFDVELQQRSVHGADVGAAFADVVRLAETPLLRTAGAPLLTLSKTVREAGFKVVLTGEGADELFAGYSIFAESQVRRFWARRPDSPARPKLLGRLYPWLARDLNRTPEFTKLFFGAGLTDTSDLLYSHRQRFATTARALRLVRPDVTRAALADGHPLQRLEARLPAGFAEMSGLAQAQHLEIITFLSGYLLHGQGDRMMMGNSVEGRFPFLDHRVAEFAASLPDSLRLAGLHEKYLLRKAVGPMLPAGIAGRPKRPYRAPILAAFFGPGAPRYVQDLLAPEAVARVGVFDPAAVATLQRKCQARAASGISESDEMALVGVLSTQLLHQQLVADPGPATGLLPTKRVVLSDEEQLSGVTA